MLGWYRDGHDVQARLPLLSTWLGHVDPASTYWYLHAVPELLAHAARRGVPQGVGGDVLGDYRRAVLRGGCGVLGDEPLDGVGGHRGSAACRPRGRCA
jgi:hypothetical protein